jgi:three-Cys-motif partner protein
MDYPTASDGLPARDSGEWAREKLWYVERYIGIFNQGMKKRWPDRAYLDLMAGPGRCVVTATGAEFPGSPILALQSKVPFTQAVLVEQHPVLHAALVTRCHAPGLQPVPLIRQADCNSAEVVDVIRERVKPSSTLAFCFIDLLGFDVASETVNSITAGRRIDLVITFPQQDITRNATLSDGQEERWDSFFGCKEWREIIVRCRAGKLRRRVDLELTLFYARRLETLDYSVDLLHDAIRNTQNAPLYRPLFASKHARGSDYWKKISALDHHRQAHLF